MSIGGKPLLLNLMPFPEMEHGTWSLFPSKKHNVLLGLFWIKRNANESIALYKATLVAKRFTQCSSIDFYYNLWVTTKLTSKCTPQMPKLWKIYQELNLLVENPLYAHHWETYSMKMKIKKED